MDEKDLESNRDTSQMRGIVEAIFPVVLEFEHRCDSGHIEIHFSNGKYTRAKKLVTV